jgi:uncharacterized protein YceK
MDFPTKRIHVSFLAALLATATTTGCASMAKYDDGPAAPFAATAADLGMPFSLATDLLTLPYDLRHLATSDESDEPDTSDF